MLMVHASNFSFAVLVYWPTFSAALTTIADNLNIGTFENKRHVVITFPISHFPEDLSSRFVRWGISVSTSIGAIFLFCATPMIALESCTIRIELPAVRH